MKGSVFWAAMTLGIVMTAAGIGLLAMRVTDFQSARLILCAGLGLIFGAFGANAVIQQKGIAVAGVAAITLIILLAITYISRDNIVRLQISGDVNGARIQLYGSEAYSAEKGSNRQEIIIIGNSLTADAVELNLSFPAAQVGQDSRSVIFPCISNSEIAPHLGSGRILQWVYDDKHGQLRTTTGRTIAPKIGFCPGTSPDAPRFSLWPQGWAIRAATAQALDVDALLNDLESDVDLLRRESRTKLAALGLASVRPLIERLSARRTSYRVQLGVVVALTEMLRTRKSQRKEVSALINDDELRLLAEAAAQPDRTVRIYASEFLYDLGDPRLVAIAIDAIPQAGPDGKYNLLVVIRGAMPDLAGVDRPKMISDLQVLRPTLGARSSELVDQIVAGN